MVGPSSLGLDDAVGDTVDEHQQHRLLHPKFPSATTTQSTRDGPKRAHLHQGNLYDSIYVELYWSLLTLGNLPIHILDILIAG